MRSLLLLLLAQVIIFNAATWSAPVPKRLATPGITKSNCDRLQRGMTKSQVTDLFGREPLNAWDNETDPSIFESNRAWLGVYKTNEIHVMIFFDINDKVVDAAWQFPPTVGGQVDGIK